MEGFMADPTAEMPSEVLGLVLAHVRLPGPVLPHLVKKSWAQALSSPQATAVWLYRTVCQGDLGRALTKAASCPRLDAAAITHQLLSRYLAPVAGAVGYLSQQSLKSVPEDEGHDDSDEDEDDAPVVPVLKLGSRLAGGASLRSLKRIKSSNARMPASHKLTHEQLRAIHSALQHALLAAARRGHVETCRMLLTHRAAVMAAGPAAVRAAGMHPAVKAAARAGHAAVVDALLKAWPPGEPMERVVKSAMAEAARASLTVPGPAGDSDDGLASASTASGDDELGDSGVSVAGSRAGSPRAQQPAAQVLRGAAKVCLVLLRTLQLLHPPATLLSSVCTTSARAAPTEEALASAASRALHVAVRAGDRELWSAAVSCHPGWDPQEVVSLMAAAALHGHMADLGACIAGQLARDVPGEVLAAHLAAALQRHPCAEVLRGCVQLLQLAVPRMEPPSVCELIQEAVLALPKACHEGLSASCRRSGCGVQDAWQELPVSDSVTAVLTLVPPAKLATNGLTWLGEAVHAAVAYGLPSVVRVLLERCVPALAAQPLPVLLPALFEHMAEGAAQCAEGADTAACIQAVSAWVATHELPASTVAQLQAKLAHVPVPAAAPTLAGEWSPAGLKRSSTAAAKLAGLPAGVRGAAAVATTSPKKQRLAAQSAPGLHHAASAPPAKREQQLAKAISMRRRFGRSASLTRQGAADSPQVQPRVHPPRPRPSQLGAAAAGLSHPAPPAARGSAPDLLLVDGLAYQRGREVEALRMQLAATTEAVAEGQARAQDTLAALWRERDAALAQLAAVRDTLAAEQAAHAATRTQMCEHSHKYEAIAAAILCVGGASTGGALPGSGSSASSLDSLPSGLLAAWGKQASFGRMMSIDRHGGDRGEMEGVEEGEGMDAEHVGMH